MGSSFDYKKIRNQLHDISEESGAEVLKWFNYSFWRCRTPWIHFLKGNAPDFDCFWNVHLRDWEFNMIPGDCARELLVLCFDKDNLNDRLRETIYHAGIYCRGETRIVIFLTTKWDYQTYINHRNSIKKLEHEGVSFWFVLISYNGATKLNV